MPKKRRKRKPRVKDPFVDLNKKVDLILSSISSLKRDAIENKDTFTEMIDHLEFCLKKSQATNISVEDTLLNVLLAIRQNEYLHAWYPAQQGIPGMKVVGSHPLSAAALRK